jgi:anti-sigma-K factor RskA
MTDHVDELLGLYALGGLEPDERERVEAHLAGCASCRREAEAMRSVADVVAQSVRPAPPPPAARARVLQRIGAASPRRPVGRGWGLARWVPAALSVAVVVGMLGWNIYLSNELSALRERVALQEQVVRVVTSPEHTEVILTGQGAMAQAVGRAYLDEATQSMAVIAWRLRPLDPTQTYQLWVITDAGPQPSALFNVNAQGWGVTAVQVSPALREFKAIGISVEPAGGSQTPTEVVMVGGL